MFIIKSTLSLCGFVFGWLSDAAARMQAADGAGLAADGAGLDGAGLDEA